VNCDVWFATMASGSALLLPVCLAAIVERIG
jgi:hypothetical protein